MKPRAALVLLACLALCVGAPVLADSWRYEAKLERKETHFGDTRLVEIVDARKNQVFPDFALEFWRGKTLLARYPGIGFDRVFASPDQQLFVGLSNDGMPGTAAAVFGRDGDLRLLARHDVAAFDYCQASVTRVRNWYDEQDTGLEFNTDAQHGGTVITLRDCHGRRANLLSLLTDAYRRAADIQPTAAAK